MPRVGSKWLTAYVETQTAGKSESWFDQTNIHPICIRNRDDKLTAAETTFGWTVQGEAKLLQTTVKRLTMQKSMVMVLQVNADNSDKTTPATTHAR